jgi:hypothetical protein
MSSDRIDLLLQECLAAYDQGLTPEECLSAFPSHRAELEPLFRQALSLRVAYAAAPREAFRQRARDRLMFAAGREVSQAYAQAEPDQKYVARARERLLEAAGASAQEALRAVPPPRLPFWVNARRRLLEVASQPRPQPSQAPAMALRRGLSMAVVVLALAVAGVAYIATQGGARPVSADIAQLEHDLAAVEAQARAGQTVPAQVIVDLSNRTAQLVEKLNEQPAAVQSAEKLPSIIERQQAVATNAIIEGPAPEVRQAQQSLAQAEEKVVRLFAASAATPTTQAGSAASPTSPAPSTPTAASRTPTSVPPTATSGPSTVSTPPALQSGEVRVALLPSDSFGNLSWTEVRTRAISFVVPSDWTIVGIIANSAGIATLDGNNLRIQNAQQSASVMVTVNVVNGEAQAIVDGGTAIRLRASGPDSAIAPVSELAGVSSGPALYHIADSIELVVEPTPVPTATPTPTAVPPTATPVPPTATPVPPTATPVPPTAIPTP